MGVERDFPGGAQVPFCVPEITDGDVAAVDAVLHRGWLTTGQEARWLESELAEYLGGVEVVATSSCTAALEIAAAHLRLAPGARVGVPTWTYAASAVPFARSGAVPVLLDVDPATLNVSLPAVEAAIAEGLDALVAVHLGGAPVGKEILDCCATAGVPVVEDQAHALGARDHRGLLAGRGTAGACLSFYATKNLPAGEGGALVTDDPELAAFARTYRLHGVTRDSWDRRSPDDDQHYDVVEPGIKGNLPDLLAALARSQLARFDQNQARRRAVARHYRMRLAEVPGLRAIPAETDADHAHHLMVVVLPSGAERPAVVAALASAGIASTVHYPPLHRLSWFRAHAQIGPAGVAVAEALAGRVLSLPIYPGLALDDVDRVCDVLERALGT